jgi:hypothetical protein
MERKTSSTVVEEPTPEEEDTMLLGAKRPGATGPLVLSPEAFEQLRKAIAAQDTELTPEMQRAVETYRRRMGRKTD